MRSFVRIITVVVFMIMPVFLTGCGQNASKEVQKDKQVQSSTPVAEAKTETETEPVEAPIVTFVELGSVRCIPCQEMQPIMKSVEKRFGSQVKVVFHDVWTPEGQPYGAKYKISVIPTQIFLDKDGVEYFRHEGFFPEEELVKVLFAKGVK